MSAPSFSPPQSQANKQVAVAPGWRADCPEEGEEGFIACLNPDSLSILNGYVEPTLALTQPGDRFQFERLGYFCTDQDSTPDLPVFNLTVSLKDTWAKIEKSNKAR